MKLKKKHSTAVALVRADPPFISGGDSSFVPGISAVQIGSDLYQPTTITYAAEGGNSGAASTTTNNVRGSRAARAGGRKMLEGEQQAATNEQATNANSDPNNSGNGVVMIQGEPYYKVNGR